MNKLKSFYFLLFLVALFSFPNDINAQCAMCKAVVKSGSEDNAASVGTTLNMAILYLMGIPYVLAGVGGFIWWKKSKAEKNEENNPSNS